MSKVHSVSADRRRAIVSRIGGGTTIITAASLQNEAELAFAVRFLMDHYAYKRSKAAGVNADALSQAVRGASEAIENFIEEVADPRGIEILWGQSEPKVETPKVSGLGQGVVSNPFNYV